MPIRHGGILAKRVSTWPRALLPQRNCAWLIQADNVERVLADIDADHGDRGVELLRHGVLLVFGAPCQLLSLAGREHGRTIPLAEVVERSDVFPGRTRSCTL